MNHADAPRAPEDPSAGDGSRRRWLITAVGTVLTPAAALIATGLLLTGPDDGQDDDRVRERAAESEWAEGITPEWMSERMGLDVPDAARSPRAAYEVTSRFDTGLLTFTLTRPQAERYLEEHPSRGRWLEPTSAQTDSAPHDFTHLGLPEPETFKKGVRYGYVCPGAAGDAQSSSGPYDTSDERCVRLYAHEYAPKRTRIYLRTHFEPGISPLPRTPSP
ncbi:hypothetical protein [Streptomyces sp. NPDC005907]|uniref:hypothetical protein n=1 Tax=Streptomyces sp. NPDC005907 TaxID=3154571 RepID=UPI0033E97922